MARPRRPVLTSIVLALATVGAVEGVCHVLALDRAVVRENLAGPVWTFHQPDPELLWSLRPNMRMDFEGTIIATNGLGLRDREVEPKRAHEYRILSLGESTTWGQAVAAEATYSARLERHLNEAARLPRTFRVVNAGVSAYSSFQSWKYLELRGLQLDPDMVLFYHEFNDFLPTTYRDTHENEVGLARTDWETYDSPAHGLRHFLAAHSAAYRLVLYRFAQRRIAALQADDRAAPDELYFDGEKRKLKLPMRVAAAERPRILEGLLDLCRRHGVTLVVIHPSYAMWDHRECPLTEFCARHDVPMFDAFESLQPPGEPPGALFVDPVHPNARGHAALAEDLFQFLLSRGLVPLDAGSEAPIP